jgi:murein DD-endopeptidase MepM/ murein hydrolase activator NlpD
MGLRYHTVILVPHARARFRKWRVSNLQLGIAVSALALLTLTAGFSTWSFLTTTVDRREVEQVRSENQELRQVNQTFEKSIRELQQQLSEYDERTRRLAIVAGLDALSEGTEAGIGGTGSAGDPRAWLTEVAARTERLDGNLDRIAEKLEERSRWISATPAIAPVRGVLTSGFGLRRDPITGRREAHSAIDIAASPGKAVQAPADGLVTRAGAVGGGLGNAVFLSHGFGVTTRYGHLSRVAVSPGERVRRGDVIGYVGNTGRSTGYHLHYEVLVDGQPVNPLGYIVDGGS